MDKDEHIRILQLAYASVVADMTRLLGDEGVLENVTQRKRVEQMEQGPRKAAQFGITSADLVFTRLSALFGCAEWRVQQLDEGFVAETRSCLLSGLARQMNAPSPCRLYCLDPMEGLVRGVSPGAGFQVEETLWEGDRCRVNVPISRQGLLDKCTKMV